MQNRFCVGDFVKDVAASTLLDLFEPYGFVMDVKLAQGTGTEHALGSASVTMATVETAGVAMKALNGASLHGPVIRVNVAYVQPSRMSTHPGGES